MKKKVLIIVLLVVLVLAIGGGIFLFMNNNKSNEIQGVWSLETVDVGVGERARTRDDCAFILFVTEDNYSIVRDFSETDPYKNMMFISDPKRDFAADAGKYEYDGKEFVVKHTISSFPVLGEMTFKCTMEDDSTLILEPQYDKMVLPGLDWAPTEDGRMGDMDLVMRYVLKRIE